MSIILAEESCSTTVNVACCLGKESNIVGSLIIKLNLDIIVGTSLQSCFLMYFLRLTLFLTFCYYDFSGFDLQCCDVLLPSSMNIRIMAELLKKNQLLKHGK